MGIVKIDDALHEEIRKASGVMVRSINAQAEYWIKIGMLAEANPNLSYSQIISEQLEQANVNVNVNKVNFNAAVAMPTEELIDG
ncbi:ParD-like family protein [Psychrobacter arenosus]|uniref:ParD-like family protein n=1 Tax=Psychrobacter arenosus TaxID=256326 RepID=UPI00191A6ECF|nr:ParD-like family protein [Psychrobacter arenosus]